MLVLKRSEGEWIAIQHRSGDVLMIRTYDIVGAVDTARGALRGRLNVACHDPDRNFEIERVRWFDPPSVAACARTLRARRELKS
jgi:hypothetical protein